MIVDSYPKIFGFESIDNKSLVNLSRYLSFLENNENFVPVILKGKPFAHQLGNKILEDRLENENLNAL